MYSLLFLAISSLVLSALLTPLVRTAALRLNLVDHPDAARKPDYRPIPRVGGIAVAISFVSSYLLWWLTPLRAIWTVQQQNKQLVEHLAPAVGLVFVIGILDDLLGLNAWLKFAGQIVASVIAYYAGVHVLGFGGAAFHQWWTLPATVLWLVACTNAINLIERSGRTRRRTQSGGYGLHVAGRGGESQCAVSSRHCSASRVLIGFLAL